jgi:hypothetical protein
MSPKTLRFLIAGVLSFHGIGHLMGVIAGLSLFRVDASSPAWLKGWNSHSWLLSGLLGDMVSRVLCIVLFGAAFVTAIAAALGLLDWLVPHESWRTLAISSAVISLVAVILFWRGLMLLFPHKAGAIGLDIATLVCLLVLNWPSEAAIGF